MIEWLIAGFGLSTQLDKLSIVYTQKMPATIQCSEHSILLQQQPKLMQALTGYERIR